jgi:hypothetical protein
LTNEHVVHLASIVKVGAKVRVLQNYAGGVSETAPLSSLFSFWESQPAKPTARKPARPAAKKATAATAKTAPPQKASPSPKEAKAASPAEASKGAQ